jgi:hypothetical protein
MIWRYGEQDWSFIENNLLIKCADSQKRLDRIDQYVESLLALLKNSRWLSTEEATHYADELLANVGKLDKGKTKRLQVSQSVLNSDLFFVFCLL